MCTSIYVYTDLYQDYKPERERLEGLPRFHGDAFLVHNDIFDYWLPISINNSSKSCNCSAAASAMAHGAWDTSGLSHMETVKKGPTYSTKP